MAVIVYLAAIVAANLSVAAFGPAVAPINAFFLIGLDLTLRDRLHDRWGFDWRMLALIATGGALSWLLNRDAGQIAIASTAAFAIAALADSAAYAVLEDRPRLQRVNGSNIVGAGVDSLVFPTLAFGGLLPMVVLAQFAAKVAGGFLWSLVLRGKPKPVIRVGPPEGQRWHRGSCGEIWGYGCTCGGIDAPK